MDVLFFSADDAQGFAYEDYLPLLPPARREKVLACRNLLDRKLSAAVYLLLLTALRRNGIEAHPRIVIAQSGKPLLAEPAGWHFNFSHCERGAVCVLAKQAVGVDIQEVRAASDALLRRAMCEQEREYISNSPDPDRAFTRLWSRKESILKRSGEGIRAPLQNCNSLQSPDTDTYDGGDFFLSLTGGKVNLVRVGAAEFALLLP